ncbi:hypothetical protein GB874_21155 [Klebsiella pneumoniae]|nr:hypothetical protein GB874_21155 [Klebsiella pneumoniae]
MLGSHTVDIKRGFTTYLALPGYQFLPGRTGDARPFNRASNTIDYCLSARTGAWVGVCSRHQSCS